MRSSPFTATTGAILLVSAVAGAAPLVINGAVTTNACPGGTVRDGGRACEYGGTLTFDYVDVRNGGVLYVKRFDGANIATSGNLVVKATGLDPTGRFSIHVDRTSKVVGKGLGYQAKQCDTGGAPPFAPSAGGRGGCAVRDSGGGGGHIGGGGRGTKTRSGDFDEACGSGVAASGTACQSYTFDPACYNDDGLPSVAGTSFMHSPFSYALGAAGGDKGCADGDGFDPGNTRGGDGGGRVVLFAANAGLTGALLLEGQVIADGDRGCASGNDPAGGGAGGTVLLIGDTLTIAATARVTARGGRGGDAAVKCLPCNVNSDCETGQTCIAVTDALSGATRKQCGPCSCTACTSNIECNAALGQTCKAIGGNVGTVCADASNRCTNAVADDETECVGTQNSGECSKGGGGGGGGQVTIEGRTSAIDPAARIDAAGGPGGQCPGIGGEAGTGAPITTTKYVGEICDGYDNDLNGVVDDDLPPLHCSDGSSPPSCVNGVPELCPCPAATGSACDNGKLGACRVTGTAVCNDDHLGVTCSVAADPGPAPATEICNGVDDDCDGVVDVSAGGVHVCEPDAGVAETPDAGTTETPDAGTTETPDAGTTETPDAGRADAGDAASADANDGGCSCRAEGHGRASGPLALAGLGLAVFLDRRRRRR